MLVSVGRAPLVAGPRSRRDRRPHRPARRASRPTTTCARRARRSTPPATSPAAGSSPTPAFREGEIAAENAMGHDAALGSPAVPRPIYTDPEIAGVGLTEAQAREQYGDAVAVGVFPWVANARAVMSGTTAGWVKSIHETTYGELLGHRHRRPARDRPDRGRRRRDRRGVDGRDGGRRHRAAPDALRGDQGGRARRARPGHPSTPEEALMLGSENSRRNALAMSIGVVVPAEADPQARHRCRCRARCR